MRDAGTMSPPRAWGVLGTVAWALLAAGLSIAVSLPFVLWWMGDDVSAEVTSDGVMFAVLTCLTTPVQVAALALAAHLAKWRVTDYLGLFWPNRREVVLALWITVVFTLGFDGLTLLLNRDVVTPF